MITGITNVAVYSNQKRQSQQNKITQRPLMNTPQKDSVSFKGKFPSWFNKPIKDPGSLNQRVRKADEAACKIKGFADIKSFCSLKGDFYSKQITVGRDAINIRLSEKVKFEADEEQFKNLRKVMKAKIGLEAKQSAAGQYDELNEQKVVPAFRTLIDYALNKSNQDLKKEIKDLKDNWKNYYMDVSSSIF